MRLKLLAGILFLSLTQLCLAQNKHSKPDFSKFKAEKVAYITEAIELTPTEAQLFWPIYNEYETKKWEIISERHKMEKTLYEGVKDLTDKEYIDLCKKFTSYQSFEGRLMEEYNEKFLKILPPKKVVNLYVAEIKFKGTLLRKYRDEKRDNEDKK